ncbi:hypothetical protein CRE_20461 [Caenorhabditis remanei]|uniref:Calpain catalytic domain-containing protein n=1 Tax=Caenorhabditis remanei TaxID=31234 RepID=E3N2V1_CAERE|nr:hypothetical protein CRE_20461 [Caenorhabditis remanei]
MTFGEDIKERIQKRGRYPLTQEKSWRRLSNDPKTMPYLYWISPTLSNDVFQMGVGNCALVAALSSVSSNRQLLRNMFPTSTVSVYGVYRVRLCVDGEWKMILVDDWFPHRNDREWITVATNNLLWAPLVEKAIAKVRGGYSKLIGFPSIDTYSLLTGAPTTRYYFEKRPSILSWNMVYDAGSNGFPMACSTNPFPEVKKRNLLGNHAFSVVEVGELGDAKYLRLRNSWGYNRVKFDEWSLCSPELADLLKMENVPTIAGSFYVEWKMFLKYFGQLTICRYRPHWSVLRVNMVIGGKWDDSQKNILIHVPRNCEICVKVINPNNRTKYRTWISIHRVDELDSNECDELLMCELIQESSRDISLIPGDYILMITELLGVKVERNVAIYTSIPISARICSWNPKFLIDVFQKARRDISIQKYTDNEDSFMVVMAENYTIDKYLHVHIHFSHTAFIQFSRNDVDKQFADVIPPRRRQILIVSYHSPVFDGKGFGMNVEYWVSKESKTKIGRSDRAEHVPSIRSDEYVHFTTVID